VALLATCPPLVLWVAVALRDGAWIKGYAYVVGKVVGVLVRASQGWVVNGLWTPVVVWLVWWPAWVVGAWVVLVGAGEMGGAGSGSASAGSVASQELNEKVVEKESEVVSTG